MSDEEFIITTDDMLEIVAGGGNGVELVNISALLAQAAKELREKDEKIANLKEDIAEYEEAHKGRCRDWLYWKDQDARLREELAAAQSRITDLTKISATLNVRTSKLNALREENARLREALKVAANFLDDAYTDTGRDEYKVAGFVARAAIWEGETR